MKNLYDVQQLLKKFGIFVHLGKRAWDIELMMDEVRDLYDAGMIEKDLFIHAMLILKQEHRLEMEKISK